MEGVCHADPKPQPCSITLLGGGEAVCPGSTVTLNAEICNLGDECPGSYEFYGEQTEGPATIESVGFDPGSITVQPGLCEPVEIHINIAAASDPGWADMQVTATSPTKDCPPLTFTSCSTEATVGVIGDIDGDANHDGAISLHEPDESLEMDLPGVIVLCNNDDDNEDGVKDNTGSNAETVDNGADGDDLAQVVLRAMPDLADGASVTLTLQDATNVAAGVNAQAVVRVFTGNSPDSGTQVILGGGPTGPTVFPLPEDDPAHDVDLAVLRAADVSLWVEGLEFAGEVKLEMEVNDGAESTCSDQIQLKVAPFIMLPNTATASRVLVADNDPDFHDAIEDLAGPTNVITTTAGDRWTQDAWEFGFSSRPVAGQLARVMRQGFETLRAGCALQGWGRAHLLGPAEVGTDQMGLIERLAETDDPLAYGGNLELLPAYDGYPLGRILVGTMPQLQKEFLTRQGVQAPLVELDTSWLSVGHIDEFMAMIPPSSDEPWDIVWASPLRAFETLMTVEPYEPLFYRDADGPVFSGQASGGTQDTLEDDDVDFIGEPFFAYVRIYDGTGKGQVAELDPTATTHTTLKVKNVWLFDDLGKYQEAVRDGVWTTPSSVWPTVPDDTSKYILVPWSKTWQWIDDSVQPPEMYEFPAIVTAKEILDDVSYAEHNLIPTQNAIDTAKDSVTSALPLLHPMTFIDIPALYLGDARDGSSWAFAWAPGMANMQVWNDALSTSLWIPKPFGARLTVGTLRVDALEAAADEVLSSGRFLCSIDDWNHYHRWMGEVHCGTNVFRIPPDSATRWWDQQPD